MNKNGLLKYGHKLMSRNDAELENVDIARAWRGQKHRLVWSTPTQAGRVQTALWLK
jgi:hypothetical protein